MVDQIELPKCVFCNLRLYKCGEITGSSSLFSVIVALINMTLQCEKQIQQAFHQTSLGKFYTSISHLFTSRLPLGNNASDNSTRLIMSMYYPWNIISLNAFLWMTALDWMTLNNTKSEYFIGLFRVTFNVPIF